MCLEEYDPPVVIQLFESDYVELTKQQELIDNQWRILHALERQRDSYIIDHYGINVTEEDWELDLVEGTLRHG